MTTISRNFPNTLAICLFSLIFLSGCAKHTQVVEHAEPFPKDWASLRISLVRGCGDLPCPSYSVSIQGEGTVGYEGKAKVPTVGKRTGTISKQELVSLVQQARKISSISAQLKDFFAFDSSWMAVTVSADGKTYQVKGRRSDGFQYPSSEAVSHLSPPGRAELDFMKLADAIDAAAKTDQWTKCSPACMMYLFHFDNLSTLPDPELGPYFISVIERKEPMVLGGIPIPPQALIEAGARVNVADSRGVTPLMAAAAKGDADLVRVLLQHGARLDLKDKKHRTAIDYAKTAEIKALLSTSTPARS